MKVHAFTEAKPASPQEKSYIDVTAHVSAGLNVDVCCSFRAIQMVDYLSQ